MPEGYDVRELSTDDATAMADAYRRNRRHLEPWEPYRPEIFYTEDGQRHGIEQQLALVASGLMVAWGVWHGDRVVGRINLNNIVQGVLRSASVGYWVDHEHLGRGVAGGAVEHACAEARARGLHRVDAGTMLANVASQRVLLKAGFEEYGLARKFLFIGDAWQDHRLFQRILHDDPLPRA
jgi:[ribosomal protein S5]-alanine N-acetyltransferase